MLKRNPGYLINNLCVKYRYTERGAKEVCIYVIDSDLAKKIVKLIKESKARVQAAIQGDKVRVTGKKRDDLQQIIALLRESSFDLPLQFNNFRD